MTLKQFVREYRIAIDAVIHRQVPSLRLNDAERRLWVLNDEGLYLWARTCGVRC